MFSGIPNFSWTVGYTNASYTLKSDLTSQYMSRLVNYMDSRDFQSCTPIPPPKIQPEKNLISSLTSGYVQRGTIGWPKQGNLAPWTLTHNYLKDYWLLNFGRLFDRNLKFKPLGEKV
jgi:monooxygenase